MTYYHVPAGTRGQLIEDARDPDQKLALRPYQTRRARTFTAASVVIHPSGRVGVHGPANQTVGGRFASEGYAGFADGRYVLLVPATAVVESSPEDVNVAR